VSTPGGEVLGEARIEVEADTDPATRALQQFSRDAQGRIRDVRGRFVTESDAINRALGGLRAELDTDPATRALDEFTRDAQGRLRDLRGRFVTEGTQIRDSLRDSGRDGGNSFLSGFTNAMRQIPDAIGSALSAVQGAAQRLAQNPYVQAAGAAIAAGIATVAVPLIGSLIAAATISVAGLGVIGLGAVILKDEPQVAKAAQRLTETVRGIFDKAAEPLIKPFTDAIKSIEQTAKDLAPQIGEAFELAAPLVDPLVDGLDRFAKSVMPGVLSLLRGARPVFDGLSDAMDIIGDAVGDAFAAIGTQGPEAGQAIRDVATVVGGLIRGFGFLVAILADVYGHVRQFVTDVIGFFQNLYDTLVGNSIIPDLVNEIVAWFAGLPERAVSALSSLGSRIAGVARAAGSSMLTAVRNGLSDAVSAVRGLPGRVSAALSALGGTLARVARGAFQRFRDAASDRISSIVDLARGLPGRVLGVLGGLGSRLYNSGRALIQGFINGILDQISAVRSAASRLVDAAGEYFPGSPAKEGRFSGSGWTLHSGRAVVDAFAEGMQDRLNTAVRASSQVTAATAGALPGGLQVGATRTATAGTTVVNNNITVNLTNAGVLGSRQEVEDFLSTSLDRLARTGRLPAALTGGS